MLMRMMLIMIRLMLMMMILMTQLLHWILLNDDDTTDSASALNTTSGDGINVSSINTHHIECLTTPFWIMCNDLQFHGFIFCWVSFVRRKVVAISSWTSWGPVLSSRVYQEVDQRFVYLVSEVDHRFVYFVAWHTGCHPRNRLSGDAPRTDFEDDAPVTGDFELEFCYDHRTPLHKIS